MRSAAAVSLLVIVGVAHADRVDDLVRAEMAKSHAPGVAIAVLRDGKVVRMQAYGLANIETKTPVTKATPFRIASMSKQFCAAALLLLVEDGKAALDDSVRKWLPDAPETWQSITLRHLLTHTGGIPNLDRSDGFPFETTLNAEETLQLLFKKPLRRAAGVQFEYSNFGYSVLGYVVGKISGTSLDDVVTRRIFAPLGMTQSAYYTPYGLVPNRAAGYSRTDTGVENVLFLRPPFLQGSGGIIASIDDLAKWDAALDTDRPLSKKIRDQIWTGYVKTRDEDRYGFGWVVAIENGKRVVRHSGGTIGFTSNLVRHLDDHLSVIVIENVADGGAVKLSEEIGRVYLRQR